MNILITLGRATPSHTLTLGGGWGNPVSPRPRERDTAGLHPPTPSPWEGARGNRVSPRPRECDAAGLRPPAPSPWEEVRGNSVSPYLSGATWEGKALTPPPPGRGYGETRFPHTSRARCGRAKPSHPLPLRGVWGNLVSPRPHERDIAGLCPPTPSRTRAIFT